MCSESSILCTQALSPFRVIQTAAALGAQADSQGISAWPLSEESRHAQQQSQGGQRLEGPAAGCTYDFCTYVTAKLMLKSCLTVPTGASGSVHDTVDTCEPYRIT